MKKFPSIEQYRNVVKEIRSRHDYTGNDEQGSPVYLHTTPYPTLRFIGTVKCHGTNGGIVVTKEGVTYQSRNRELTIQYDNVGFALAMSAVPIQHLIENAEYREYVAIYGEWIGQGIQSGVSVSNISPRKWVVFAYNIDGVWQRDLGESCGNWEVLKEHNIHHINHFPTYEIDIDFNHPELSQNKLIEMTQAVENECPVGAAFGISGTGEGIVFRCDTVPSICFKSKGEKHSVTKVKKLNSVNVEEIYSIQEFVEYAVTENRLQQGITYLQEQLLDIDIKNTGVFLKWVANDTFREEQDVIVQRQLPANKLGSYISKKAREWYMEKLQESF